MYTPVGFFAPQGGGYVTDNLLQYIDPFASTIGGGTASDLSGNGNSATLQNSITTDSNGWILDSSATPRYLNLGLGGTNTDTTFSIEVFMRLNTGATFSSAPTFVGNFNNITNKLFAIYFDDGANKRPYTFIRASGGDSFVELGTNVVDNTYHHYVMVRTSTTSQSFYKDGTLLGSSAVSGTSTTSADWWAGGPHPAFPSRYINGGRMGLTRLYTSALSAAQVLQNYNANKADYGL